MLASIPSAEFPENLPGESKPTWLSRVVRLWSPCPPEPGEQSGGCEVHPLATLSQKRISAAMGAIAEPAAGHLCGLRLGEAFLLPRRLSGSPQGTTCLWELRAGDMICPLWPTRLQLIKLSPFSAQEGQKRLTSLRFSAYRASDL